MSTENRHVAPDPSAPYNELPPPPPASVLENTEILKLSIAARDALARLREAAASIPNPAVVINAIPLLEARDSSRIENIVTTTDELFQHHGDPSTAHDPAVKEALRYRTALLAGFQSLAVRPTTTRTAVDIATALLGTDTDIRKVPGTVLKNSVTDEVVYTPPVGEALLRDKLADWERFIHDESIDALVRMAAGHYQFEAIHPFIDGNGRCGRILNTLLIVEAGLLGQPLLYLSRFILEHRNNYYRLLRDVTFEGAWQPWIEFMLAGVCETADWTAYLLERIDGIARETDQYLRDHAPRAYSHDLAQLLFTYPYVRIANVVEAGIARRQTASDYLQKLVEIDVLDEIRSGREKLFLNRRLLQLLRGDLTTSAFP